MKTDKQEEIKVRCGKESDSLETLMELCKNQAEELKKTIDLQEQDEVTVSFWTEDFPELICVGTFRKTESGEIVYDLDDSESTL